MYDKKQRENIYFLAAKDKKMSICEDIKFQGRYFIGFRDEKGFWRKIVAIGSSYLEAAGKIVQRGKEKHIFSDMKARVE